MASFAEGLAKGLMQGQELDLRRSADRRAEAISLAKLANSAEEMEVKRQQRKRDDDFREGMSNLYTSLYNPEVEEQVPVKSGAIADPNAPAQMTTQKVRKTFGMGERSEEGRARDLQYMMGYTKLLIDNGKITPDQMKQSMEFTRYLEGEGLKDSLAALMLNPNDTKAAGTLAKRFNLNPESVNFEVVTKGADGKELVIPKFVLNAKNAAGTPVQYDVSNALQAIGVSTLADIQKNAGTTAKTESEVTENQAQALKADAEAKQLIPAKKRYYDALADTQPDKASAKAAAAAAKRGTEYDIFNKAFQAQSGNKGPSLPWKQEIPGEGVKSIGDDNGYGILTTIGTRMIDSGMGGGQAFRMASDILFKINQAALADYNNYEAQLKANPKAYGLDEKKVNRSLMDPNFKLEKFEEFRKRQLEIYFKNVEARQGGE
jgi:hypothetical protein